MSARAAQPPFSRYTPSSSFNTSRQSMPPPEFYPRQSHPHQNCSHVITDSGPKCGLALLDQVTNNTAPTIRGSGSSSSSLSSSSIHTQPAIGGVGSGWIQPTSSIWGRPDSGVEHDTYRHSRGRGSKSRASTSLSDDYHLLSMADGIVEEEQDYESDILFNPSSLKPATKRGPSIDLNPTNLTSAQITALAAALAIPPTQTQSQSPQVAQLVSQATRLAKGLAHPPTNRGFRAKANEMIDRDESNTTVFVGGLSQGVTESVLNDIFTPYGDIAYVKIPPGKGCGFVQFNSKQGAEHAIRQMQGFECLGCSLRTHWGRSQSAEKVGSTGSATGAVSDQVSGQVTSICTALGVPKEHVELVMRVMAACSAGAEGGPPS